LFMWSFVYIVLAKIEDSLVSAKVKP